MKPKPNKRSSWSKRTFFWYVLVAVILCSFCVYFLKVQVLSGVTFTILVCTILSGALHSKLIQFDIREV